MKNYFLEIIPYYLNNSKGKIFILSEKYCFFRHRDKTSFSWFKISKSEYNELFDEAKEYYIEYYSSEQEQEESIEYFFDDIENYEIQASSIEEACNIALQDF